VAILLYGFLNFFFYFALLQYQSGSEAAFYINSLPAGGPVAILDDNSYSFAFYLKSPVYYRSLADIKNAPVPAIVFTPKDRLDSLEAAGFAVEVLRHFPHFHISQLTGAFVNYRTRAGVTTDYVVARIRAGR